MKFKTTKGELIEGSSPIEVLMNLKNGSRFGAPQELNEYLTKLCNRLKEFYGTEIIASNHDELLEQFQRIGFLVKLD